MLGANLGLPLYGEISVMPNSYICEKEAKLTASAIVVLNGFVDSLNFPKEGWGAQMQI